MTLRIRLIDPDATPSSQVSLEALARVLPEATVAEVLKECNATERRTRKLSAAFVVLLCVAMNLYTNDCISHLFFRLLSRVRWLLADPTTAPHVSKGALCARPATGWVPGGPLLLSVQEGLLQAFGRTRNRPRGVLVRAAPYGCRRHCARLARHPRENVRVFGKRHSPRATSAWPQARVVALSECATHAVLEAGVWHHDFDEHALDALTPGSSRPREVHAAFDESGTEALRELLHHSPRNFGKGSTLWTLAMAAEVSFEEGITEREVSGETIRATLARLGVRWERAKRWIESPDPGYARKKGLEIG
jgi:hypothetical protein